MNKLVNFSRIVFIAVLTLFMSSCNKQYTCICKTVISNQDTVVDVVQTTKLGSKGFNKTCTSYETSNAHLKECRLQ
jgi:hypothetical protein